MGGRTPGLSVITDNGGVFPHGLMPVVLVMQGVIFAYAALELVGVAAGRPSSRRRSPRAR